VRRLVVAALAVVAFAAPAFSWDYVLMDARINNDVYTIVSKTGLCTAFDSPVNPYIVTAAHCVTDENDEFNAIQDYVNANGTSYRTVSHAVVERIDRDNDVAILKLDIRPATHVNNVTFAYKVTRGEPVYAAGTPFGLRNTLTQGILANAFADLTKVFAKNAKQVYQIDAMIGPGNSGGPVYNDKGEIIGLVSAGMEQTIGLGSKKISFPVGAWNDVIPIARAKELLDDLD
jgi:S1-C subfamily serine protease